MTFSSDGDDGDEPLGLKSIHRARSLMRLATSKVSRQMGCRMVVVAVAEVGNNAPVVAGKAGE